MNSANGAINLNRLRVFTALASAGSFTRAGASLGLTKAMVSQHLARLEEELGVTLVARTTRSMRLTEAGAAFHEDCVRILDETNAAIARITVGRERPTGIFRVTSTTDYGVAVVAPALADFLQANPGLQIDLVIGDELRDLVSEQIDLSIRVGWLRDSSAHAVRLAGCRPRLVASPRYLELRGVPRTPSVLDAHDWIVGSLLPTPLTLKLVGKGGKEVVRLRRPVVQANNASAMRAWALCGLGIAALPDFLVQEDVRLGRLVALLEPLYQLHEGGVYAVYPGSRSSVKVRLFIDFLRSRLAREPSPTTSSDLRKRAPRSATSDANIEERPAG